MSNETDNIKHLKLIIVDDHEISRIGLKLILNNIEGFEVVAEAGDGEQAIKLIEEFQPNVVLMDIGLPLLDGISATKIVKEKYPGVKIIMFTSREAEQDLFAALSAGADGYCRKETPSAGIINAIKSVAAGAVWLDPLVANLVLRSYLPNQPSHNHKDNNNHHPQAKHKENTLSERELEVLRLVVDGMSNQEIANKLFLSLETIKTHMRRIMDKLVVSDRTQAAVKAMRDGLV